MFSQSKIWTQASPKCSKWSDTAQNYIRQLFSPWLLFLIQALCWTFWYIARPIRNKFWNCYQPNPLGWFHSHLFSLYTVSWKKVKYLTVSEWNIRYFWWLTHRTIMTITRQTLKTKLMSEDTKIFGNNTVHNSYYETSPSCFITAHKADETTTYPEISGKHPSTRE